MLTPTALPELDYYNYNKNHLIIQDKILFILSDF